MKRVLILCVAVCLVPLSGLAMDAETAHRIDTASDELFPSLVEARRWFHAHPELSNREVNTSAEIVRRLRGMGYEPRTGIAHNGVVAVLEGGKPGPVIAWRADIDALPITEAVDVPWKSLNEGVMHACGHDVHTTVALGTAELLMGMRDDVPGTVIFLFQPAEEGLLPAKRAVRP